MKHSDKVVSGLILATAGLLILLTLGADAFAESNPKVDELLTLRGFTAAQCPAQTLAGARAIDHVLLPDGTHEPFAIPPGHVFVVTDVRFRVTSSASTSTSVRLGTPCEVPSAGCMELWLDSVVSTANPGDAGETHLSFRHGFLIAHGVPICVAAFNGDPNTFADLHGYLAKEN